MNDQPTPEQRSEQVFFEDPAVDRLMAFAFAMAMELYVVRDRIRALETQLADRGHLDRATLGRVPDAVQSREQERDAAEFIESLMRPLLGSQDALGAPGVFSLSSRGASNG